MALQYCVFWYPTICHEVLEPLKNRIDYLDISDDVPPTHFISIALDGNNLIISSALTEEEKANPKVQLKLTYEDSSRNGLFLYSFEVTAQNNPNQRIINALDNAIYHLAKGLYHVHEHHDSDSDSTLKAYIYPQHLHTQVPRIREANNQALIHYLKQYGRKFKSYSVEATRKESRLRSIKDKSKYKERVWDLSEQLNGLCENALGEAIYYDTLRRSKYNKPQESNFAVRELPQDEKEDLCRNIANIKNYLSDIKLIKDKNELCFKYKGLQHVRKSLYEGKKIAIGGILLGALIGILGIASGVGVSLYTAQNSSEELKPVKTDLSIIKNQSRYNLGNTGHLNTEINNLQNTINTNSSYANKRFNNIEAEMKKLQYWVKSTRKKDGNDR